MYLRVSLTYAYNISNNTVPGAVKSSEEGKKGSFNQRQDYKDKKKVPGKLKEREEEIEEGEENKEEENEGERERE